MNRSVIKLEKFCLRWGWLLLAILGLVNLLFNIIMMAVPSFGLAFFFFYRFAGLSVKDGLNKAVEDHYDNCENGKKARQQALDAYFFAFIMLTGVNFLVLLLFFADRYNWF